MIAFAELWLSASLLMFTFGLAGLGLVAPFADKLSYVFLAAPVPGMALVPLVANVVYAIIGLSYRTSIVVALAVAAAGLVTQRRRFAWKAGVVHLATASVAVSLVMILLCDARAVMAGGPAIFFKYGTDQSGYAQISDWLLRYPVATRPFNDGGVWPYQSFPEILFGIDPRFGTFGLLAFISAVTRVDGLFSYPLATAVVIGCGITSCAALFTQRFSSFVLCMALLLTSQWIDYGYTGFLGRTVGYPAIIVLAGFALRTSDHDRGGLMALLVLAGAVGTSYPGFVIGIMVATIILPCLLLRGMMDASANTLPSVFAGAIAIIVPILSSGVASRPIGIGQFLHGLDWQTVLPRVLDVDDRTLPVTAFSPDTLLWMTFTGLALAAILAALALVRRNPTAAGVLIGPLAFVLALIAVGRISSVQELAGFPYATLVVGGVTLIEAVHGVNIILATTILIVEGAIRLPRLYSALFLFDYTPDPDYVFTLAEVKQIRYDLGISLMQIETGVDSGKALWLMTEFGQLKGHVSWAPDTWRAILAYRPEWVYQPPSVQPELCLRIKLPFSLYHHFTLEPCQL